MRLLVDGVPFTFGGYSRTKSIFVSKYEKATEIAAVYVQRPTSPPVNSNSNTSCMHEFYEKLVLSIQALKTMNKLKAINGYVRLTFDCLQYAQIS